MNNRKAPRLWTRAISGAGTTPSSTTIDGTVPHKGWLYRLGVKVTSGTSTKATQMELVHDNGTLVTVVAAWANVTFPFEAADVPISWDILNATHLKLRVTTDDAGNATVLSATMTGGAA